MFENLIIMILLTFSCVQYGSDTLYIRQHWIISGKTRALGDAKQIIQQEETEVILVQAVTRDTSTSISLQMILQIMTVLVRLFTTTTNGFLMSWFSVEFCSQFLTRFGST